MKNDHQEVPVAIGRDVLTMRKLPQAADYLLLSPDPTGLDVENVSVFRKTAIGAIDAGYTRLVVDLSRLRCVSSRFVESLGQIQGKARSRGGDLVLSNLNKETRDLFGKLGLEKRHAVAENLDGAVAYLDARRGFPRLHECPGCGKRLRFQSEGRFRCPNCLREIAVDRDGLS